MAGRAFFAVTGGDVGFLRGFLPCTTTASWRPPMTMKASKTGRNRTLNRKKWERAEIDQQLSGRQRSASCAFVSKAHAGDSETTVGLSSGESSALPFDRPSCVRSVAWQCGVRTRTPLRIQFHKEQVVLDYESLGLEASEQLRACFSQGEVTQGPGVLGLSAYAMAWLERKDGRHDVPFSQHVLLGGLRQIMRCCFCGNDFWIGLCGCLTD